jgi:hypothetical protein
MGNALEFMLKLTDMLTPSMRQAALASDSAAVRMASDYDKIERSAEKMSVRVNRWFDNAISATRRFENETDKAKSKAQGMSGFNPAHLLGGLGIGIGFYQVGSMIEAGIEKAHRLHEVEAALGNTMKNMGTYSQESFEKIIKGSGELAANMKFGKADVIDLQSQLRLVGNIGESEMNRMTKASADMAEKFHIGLNEAGNALAKAVNNPEMLRRLGMQLKIDPAVQQHLQDLAKNGHEAQARLELLAIVEGKVGGAAEAAFKADPLARYHKAIGAIQLQMGNAAIKIQTALAPAVEWLAKAFKSVVKVVSDVVTWMSQNKDIVVGLTIALGFLTIALSWHSIVAKGAAIATAVLEGAQAALNFVMNMNPIVRIITLLILLGTWIYHLVKKYDGWGQSLRGVWEIIKGFVKLNVIAWKDLGENIWYWIQYAWLKVKGFVEWIGGAMGNVWRAIKLAAQFKFGEAKAALTAEIKTSVTGELAELEKKHNAGQLKNTEAAIAAVKQMQTGYGMIGLKKKAGVDATGKTEEAGLGTNTTTTTPGVIGKDGADKVNSGGQRSIVINIAKQIEKLEVHVMSGKEGAVEIESQVREAMRRVLYSMNGVATSS